MKRSPFLSSNGGLAVLLLVFVFLWEMHAWGGDVERLGRKTARGDGQTKRITLSLRVAEAKGNDTSREYLQSLLRHKKRKFLRKNPCHHPGIPLAR